MQIIVNMLLKPSEARLSHRYSPPISSITRSPTTPTTLAGSYPARRLRTTAGARAANSHAHWVGILAGDQRWLFARHGSKSAHTRASVFGASSFTVGSSFFFSEKILNVTRPQLGAKPSIG